jgi:epsin
MRQQQLFLLQQQQAQQQQQQQEDMMRQQQLFQMQQQQLQNQSLFAPSQPVTAQPTGFGYVLLPYFPSLTQSHVIYPRSNNPFAPSPGPSAFNPSPRPTQQQGPSPSFNLPGTYDTHSPSRVSSLSSSPAPTQNQNQNRPIQVKTKKELGENEAHLAALFANRDDGQDTFGNIGALRCGFFYFLRVG